jgi:hypothetical protein
MYQEHLELALLHSYFSACLSEENQYCLLLSDQDFVEIILFGEINSYIAFLAASMTS